MDRIWRRTSSVGLVLATMTATLFQFPGCGFVGGMANRLAMSANPCGTILDCDPIEFDLLFRNIGMPDFDVCPISVFPADCVGVWPPTGNGAGNGAAAPVAQQPAQPGVQQPQPFGLPFGGGFGT